MPERAGGGWYPDNQRLSAPDLYVKWLNGREDRPARREEFTRETGVTLTEED